MLRVVFCASKGYEATGHARSGGLQLAHLVEHQLEELTAEGSSPSLSINAKSCPALHESGLTLSGATRRQSPEVRKMEGVDWSPHVEAATSHGPQGRR